MEILINRIKELKGIEFNSKVKLAEALENKIADINIKDMEIYYNYITLELEKDNKINIIIECCNNNKYKIETLEVITVKEIIL